ncbi:MAG: MFS transporter [Candidatus Korarchaeota archaeon]
MKRSEKISYGMARLGSSILMNTVDFVTVLIYIEIFRLEPLYTGIATAIAKIVIAITQFLAGYFSDKTMTRFGKRKPYIIVGAPLTGISYVLLYSPQILNIPVSMLFGWLLFFDSLYHIGYGILTTPYQAWLPEITETPEERLEVSAYQNTANILATFIGTLGTFLLPDIAGTPLLVVVIGVFALVEIAFYIPTLIVIKEKEPKISEVSLSRVWEDIKHMAKNRDFVIWLFVQGTASLGIILLSSVMLGYVRLVLHLSGITYYAAAMCLVVVVILSFILWKKLAKRKGNKKALTIALIYSAAILLLIYPLGVTAGPTFETQILGVIYVAFISVGLGGWYLFPYAIVADIARADEQQTGYELCGLFTGFPSIPLNAFQAVGLVLTGFLLGLPPVDGYSAGYLYWGFVAAAFLTLANIILQKGVFEYNVNAQNATAESH